MKTVLAMMLLLVVAVGAGNADDEAKGADLFAKRILPIFKSPNPSSCTQCHLAGVDLKNYILPSHEKTFVSLRDQGLIDLDKPENSKILRLINMGEASKEAQLISDKVRKMEYDAFAEWIKASAADPKLREAPKLAASELAQPKRPVEVIRHARLDKVAELFEKNVWSQRFRCTACHSPESPEYAKLVKENGEEMMWIRKEGAEATMQYLLASKLVVAKAPEQSLMLRKPTNQVKHGGGQKMLVGDMVYKGFRAWLEEYAKTVGDKYASAADLPKDAPAPLTAGSDHWVKITNTPPAWADRLLQVSIFAWDESKKAWETSPCATSDRGVFGKGKLWQHNLVLQAVPESPRAAALRAGKGSLPAGKYLLRVHVDLQGRLEKDWKATLGKADFVGEKELDGRLPEGYGSMTVVDAAGLKR
ncbi:MAG TPA: hypothetical protein VNM14_21525 [Planctomycetota bacterium]|nr:hypothetical protein [Planctomycetota bacterium]